MGKANCKMIIKGHDEIIKDIERIGGNTPKAIEKAIKIASDMATTEYKDVIKNHRYSGLTEETLENDPKVETNESKIICKTGFNIKKGGLASIFLDRGTPKHKPLHFVNKIKRKKEIKNAISNTLEKEWEKLIK